MAPSPMMTYVPSLRIDLDTLNAIGRRTTVPESATDLPALVAALHSCKPVAGLTHTYYRYPARMAPELAREVIRQFSAVGDLVFDPFMGGGTTIVEALASGRRALGIDVNPLSNFLADVKTSPLSAEDALSISAWMRQLDCTSEGLKDNTWLSMAEVANLPVPEKKMLCRLLGRLADLSHPHQQKFVRCCLLRLGQWLVDGKTAFCTAAAVQDRLAVFVEEMLGGMAEFVTACESHGVPAELLPQRRLLLNRSVVDAEHDPGLEACIGKPDLVVTSPPYPGVHVLYHRWQVGGRRETAAPYWILGTTDGHGASYYTLGSRTPLGLDNYFRSIASAFRSIRQICRPGAPVVQIVSFADLATQLPLFLDAMQAAGYHEVYLDGASRTDLWRDVPNRQWYNRVGAARGSGKELLLVHLPAN